MSAPAFGDAVRLNDGRDGTVTFVDDRHVRFVPAGLSAQSWEWVQVGAIRGGYEEILRCPECESSDVESQDFYAYTCRDCGAVDRQGDA